MSEDLKAPIPDKTITLPINTANKILKDNPIGTVSSAPKIIGSEPAFIATDGSNHPTSEGLQQANEAHFQQTNRYKSTVLGKEYPVTPEGAEQMRKDESAYWDSQKIDKKTQG